MASHQATAAAAVIVTLLAGGPVRAADALTTDAAEQAIAKVCSGCTYVWKTVQIAAPREASIGEISAEGLPPNVIVFPVRAVYTQKAGFKRDFTWNYYIYKDDFGGWVAASVAADTNTESQPY